jgi:nitroimidazol reductase NimA-like FMN-containing flavoprotein (pyridoxamine 5'-phosphate oxidase superfamily)
LFYVAADYGTRKLKNIQTNDRIALVVDVYASIRNRAVVIEGEASLLVQGPEYEKIYKLFYKKFSWVRRDPWREGEAPFIVIKPLHKVSWGL